MNWTPELPKAKKQRFWQRNKQFRPFPVTDISENNPKYVGYFTGYSVEIFDKETIQIIYDNGCYGIGSKTKATPRVCIENLALKRKCNFSDNFDTSKKSNTVDYDNNTTANTNPNSESDFKNVMNQLQIPKTFLNTTVNEKEEVQASSDLTNAPLPKTVDNELSIEQWNNLTESLFLFLEEAFFLHHSLKCLKIIDIFSNEELSTEDVLQKFCSVKSNFISTFVAYQYYRSQNWVVKCGIKYAGDFLLYYKGPQFYHGSYIVLVNEYVETTSMWDCKDMHGLYRLAETCKKDILFILVKYPSDIDLNDPMKLIENISDFQILEVSPKRFSWTQARCNKNDPIT